MDCNTCKEKRDMVSRYNFQSTVSTLERANRRLWIVILVLIIALVGSNAAWVYYESQFTDEVTETYESEASDNGTAIVNRDGEVTYGGKS